MTASKNTHLQGGNLQSLAGWQPEHFGWCIEGAVGLITLNRPERKNPLTFESYAELRDLFRQLEYVDEVRAVVVQGAGGNFCSGGDVHEIIGPLTKMSMPDLLAFTRMTGDLVKAMRGLPAARHLGHRRRLRGCWRHHRDGFGPARGHGSQQDGFLVYPGGFGRL